MPWSFLRSVPAAELPAAVEQLQIWGGRARAEVIFAPPNSDAASLAHDALSKAQAQRADILLIDTAGRLHNKSVLMEELQKIIRVIRKLDSSAPHAVLLTLDATIGQNAINQVRTFRDMVDLTGLIVTKLEQYDYAGASAIALLMLVSSFLLLFLVNLGQWWSTRRQRARV